MSWSNTLFYFPEVEVELPVPVRTPDTGELASHFFRSYYIWATDQADAVHLLTEDVATDGGALHAYEPPSTRDEKQFPRDLTPRGAPRSRGVYWRSGRVYYPMT